MKSTTARPIKRSSPEIPDNNLRSFQLLYSIENGLRELVIEELSNLAGPKWYKRRLPGDVLQKYREAVDLQRQSRWTSVVPHHPMYYVDFPDLKKIVERDDNWKEAFSKVFGRKDLIVATLSELEPSRNALAHNRNLSSSDLLNFEVASSKLRQTIGDHRFRRLISITTLYRTISEDLEALRPTIATLAERCIRCVEVRDFGNWKAIEAQWWFDESYLGPDTEPISRCLELFEEYALMPRHRGQGHVIEIWVKMSKVHELASDAMAALDRLIKSAR